MTKCLSLDAASRPAMADAATALSNCVDLGARPPVPQSDDPPAGPSVCLIVLPPPGLMSRSFAGTLAFNHAATKPHPQFGFPYGDIPWTQFLVGFLNVFLVCITSLIWRAATQVSMKVYQPLQELDKESEEVKIVLTQLPAQLTIWTM